MRIVEFAIVELIAFLSAGYRIDEQYKLPYKKNWYMIGLNKTLKKYFLFKNRNHRKDFVLMGVIEQCVAYVMFGLNLVVALVLRNEGKIEVWTWFNYWVIGIMIAVVFLNYLFYKYFQRKY